MKGSIDLCKLIVRNLPAGVWVSDENDVIIYANEAMCNIAGVPCSEIIGRSVKRDFSNEVVDEFSKHYMKVKTGLTPGEYESRVKTPCGKDTIQRGWLIPITEDGRFSGMIVTVEDITEKGILEKKLKKSEKQLKSYFENAPDGIFITDEKGFYVDVNNSACKQLGYCKDELFKMHISQTVPENMLETSKMSFENLKTKGNDERDVEFLNRDGTKGWWRLSAVKLSESRYLGFTKDITKEKQAQEELEKYRDNLEQMVQERTKELEEKNEKLSKFNKLFVEREFRIKELKDRIKELENKYEKNSSD